MYLNYTLFIHDIIWSKKILCIVEKIHTSYFL